MQALLVDNDRLLLDSLRLAIESRFPDVKVDAAASETEALALAAAQPYDLVLLDWWLGSEASEHCFTQLREAAPDARIVVMSGDDRPELVFKALELGAAGFIRKNVADFETLREALYVVRSGGVYLPGQMPTTATVSPSVRPQWLGRELAECFPQLTPRQLGVLKVILSGASDKVIARKLDIAVSTVKTHAGAVYRELGVGGRAEAVALAARLGARID